MTARGLAWLETVGAFPFEENQSGIFHFGKPEACFPYENQGVYLLVALYLQRPVAFPVHSLASPGILLEIAIENAPVIALMTSAQQQSSGPTFFFLYFLSFLFFYIYS